MKYRRIFSFFFFSIISYLFFFFFFFFNDTATTEIYTLSLHDALPIFLRWRILNVPNPRISMLCCSDSAALTASRKESTTRDRKSTRLNSSHDQISYAVFCLKKKKHTHITTNTCLAHTVHHTIQLYTQI